MGDFKKISEKNLKMRFLNNVTVPKNVKGGTLWDFLTSIVLQIIKKLKKRHFGGIQKLQKKSHSAEKNPSKKTRGGVLCYRCSGHRCFCCGRGSGVSSMLWTSVLQVDDVEQMNKKVDRSS